MLQAMAAGRARAHSHRARRARELDVEEEEGRVLSVGVCRLSRSKNNEQNLRCTSV